MLPDVGGWGHRRVVGLSTVGFNGYLAAPDEPRFRHESAGIFAVSGAVPTSMLSDGYVVLRTRLQSSSTSSVVNCHKSY